MRKVAMLSAILLTLVFSHAPRLFGQGSDRFPDLPDIPTLKQLGYPQDILGIWFAFFGPAGIPAQIKETLVPAIEKAVKDPADVLWAVTTRVNPEKDVFIVNETRVHPMDPTGIELVKPGSPLGWSRIGSKMGIDATKPPISDPEGRKVFERIRPLNLEKIKREDFL